MHDTLKCKVVARYSAVQHKYKLNPTLHIDRTSSVWKVEDLYSKSCWFEPSERHHFSSSSFCLMAYVFTDGDRQSEWMKRDDSNRVNCILQNKVFAQPIVLHQNTIWEVVKTFEVTIYIKKVFDV